MSRISPQGYSYGDEPTSTNPFWEQSFASDLDADATIDNTTGTPSVEVTKTTDEQNVTTLHFAFHNLKGEQGVQGEQGIQGIQGEQGIQGIQGEQGIQGIQGEQGEQGIQGVQGETGATPNITMNATTDNTTGTPAVQVTKTGTDENPIFTLAFTGLKGEQGIQGIQGEQGVQGETGATGATGATPSITMTASVDANVGTPSVSVYKTGTDENPLFNFAFSNLKGETGASGSKSHYDLANKYGVSFSDFVSDVSIGDYIYTSSISLGGTVSSYNTYKQKISDGTTTTNSYTSVNIRYYGGEVVSKDTTAVTVTLKGYVWIDTPVSTNVKTMLPATIILDGTNLNITITPLSSEFFTGFDFEFDSNFNVTGLYLIGVNTPSGNMTITRGTSSYNKILNNTYGVMSV